MNGQERSDGTSGTTTYEQFRKESTQKETIFSTCDRDDKNSMEGNGDDEMKNWDRVGSQIPKALDWCAYQGGRKGQPDLDYTKR